MGKDISHKDQLEQIASLKTLIDMNQYSLDRMRTTLSELQTCLDEEDSPDNGRERSANRSSSFPE